ncbi:hypothetical protein [Arthrobacter oryzae]|uniref:Membrane protein ArfC n=1 Tax=Arthrobacter oryzae TaxID=409290 RepID=A0A3N0C7P2_9MICC|nr:hypothetical protein [Arthrobacter oryzae]RNL58535.1 hypothetical protein D7003_03250 [Arthrobacter oryzae]
MDWIVWLIVIVVIVAVVWWLLNRNNSRTGADLSATAGSPAPTSGPGEPASTAPAAASVPAGGAAAEAPHGTRQPEAEADAVAAVRADAVGVDAVTADASAAPSVEPDARTKPESHAPVHHPEYTEPHAPTLPGAESAAAEAAPVGAAAEAPDESRAEPDAHVPVHHPEYTEPHAPTLPGAESAAAETPEQAGDGPAPASAASTPAAGPAAVSTTAGDHTRDSAAKAPLAEAEILQTTQSSAAAESFASHTAEPVGHTAGPADQPAEPTVQPAEPAGHLAVEQPYGEGSAAPAANGSGPDGFSVKGDASSMTYHDESSPSFEETRAEVWFLSPAHAEAAGFRPPRRTRR